MSSKEANLPHIALVGNPNSGKSTVFNHLTGLRQKTGNFPGVTVDIKEGKLQLPEQGEVLITDLPGAYSLHPTASDEKIVAAVLANPNDPFFPDAIVYVADVVNLEKHLLLLTQIIDLGIPVLLALNMADTANELGVKVNTGVLSEKLGLPVVFVSGRTGENMDRIPREIERLLERSKMQESAAPTLPPPPHPPGMPAEAPDNHTFYRLTDQEKQIAEAVRLNFGINQPYRALLWAHHYAWLPFIKPADKETIDAITQDKGFQSLRAQVEETLERYDKFTPFVQAAVKMPSATSNSTTDRIDMVLTHRFWGPLIFFSVMALIFQAIFDWSAYPMDWIENGFGWLDEQVNHFLPASWLTALFTDGILAGFSGILVFVPQIAILFLLITILEELGYMSRVVFMFDKTMRRFGMSGRSVISIIGGGACAVPAIMSARTIGNRQERLITILVTPFISCSARIPVYLVLIGLTVPPVKIGGVINLQTIVFGSMYALGVLAAFLSGWVMKKWLNMREPSYLAIELPVYRIPHWKNVWLTVWEKVSAFVMGAGKIILIVSIALWALSRFGPGNAIVEAEQRARQYALDKNLNDTQTEDLIAHHKLEASYAGVMGRAMEPVIRPLGYDWKIGVALLTSFAAREVFTGTLAVLYNMGSAESDINDRKENEAKATLRQKMSAEKHSNNGTPVFTLATAMSLLVFYALAMQCMSTLAVVHRETRSWKWPVFQFTFMSIMAYVAAFIVYNIFA